MFRTEDVDCEERADCRMGIHPRQPPSKKPVLTFISPSGRGVKAFIPYNHLPMADDANCITEKMKLAMLYTVMIYGTGTPPPFGEKKKGVDFSGKDIVRSCFLCHDPGALFRATNE